MKDRIDKIVSYFDRHKKQARAFVVALSVGFIIVATGIAMMLVILALNGGIVNLIKCL